MSGVEQGDDSVVKSDMLRGWKSFEIEILDGGGGGRSGGGKGGKSSYDAGL